MVHAIEETRIRRIGYQTWAQEEQQSQAFYKPWVKKVDQ